MEFIARLTDDQVAVLRRADQRWTDTEVATWLNLKDSLAGQALAAVRVYDGQVAAAAGSVR